MNNFLTFVFFISTGVALHGDGLMEREYRQSYPAPSEVVIMDVGRGVIDVVNGEAGSAVEIVIMQKLQKKPGVGDDVATPATATPAQYASRFAKMEPRFEADAKRVRIQQPDTPGVVFDWDSVLQMSIDVRISIPAGVALRLVNRAASVTIADNHVGDVEVRSEQGSVYAGVIQGDFTARTDSGSVTVTEVTGRSVIRSDSGLILAGRLRGAAELRTSVGSVEIQQAFDHLRVRGDNADIIVGVSLPVAKRMDLRTSAGAITLNVDQNVGFSLDASTGFLGKVKVRGLEPVVQRGGVGNARLAGELGGGGPPVLLRTRGGNIALVGRVPLEG